MTHPSANNFYFVIKLDIAYLSYGFPIAQYPLYTIFSNTYALKIRLHLDINRANTGNYGTNIKNSGTISITNALKRSLYTDNIKINYWCSPYFRYVTYKSNIKNLGDG